MLGEQGLKIGCMVWRIGELLDLYDQIDWIRDNGFQEVSFWACKGENSVWQGFDVIKAKDEEISRLRQSLKRFDMIDLHIGPIDNQEIDHGLVSQDLKIRRTAIETMAKIIRFASEIKANIITIHDGSGIGLDSVTRLSNFACALTELDDLAGRFGIRIGVEMTEDFHLVQDVNWHNVGLTFDTGHIAAKQNRCGFNAQGGLLKSLGARIYHVHIHDYDGKYDHLPIGKGRINFHEIFDALHEINYRGALCLELNPDRALPTQILESKDLLSHMSRGDIGEPIK